MTVKGLLPPLRQEKERENDRSKPDVTCPSAAQTLRHCEHRGLLHDDDGPLEVKGAVAGVGEDEVLARLLRPHFVHLLAVLGVGVGRLARLELGRRLAVLEHLRSLGLAAAEVDLEAWDGGGLDGGLCRGRGRTAGRGRPRPPHRRPPEQTRRTVNSTMSFERCPCVISKVRRVMVMGVTPDFCRWTAGEEEVLVGALLAPAGSEAGAYCESPSWPQRWRRSSRPPQTPPDVGHCTRDTKADGERLRWERGGFKGGQRCVCVCLT